MSDNTLPDAKKGFSRRKFLGGTAAVAGGLALSGTIGKLTLGQQAGLQIASAQTLKSDLDVVQFALTLEHLETVAYRTANASGILKGPVSDYFKSFGDNEQQHVNALTTVVKSLNGQPVQEQAKYNLPNLTSQNDIVSFFITLEEVGVGAYLGAAPLLQDKNLLAAALSIHNVEAQHASTLKAYANDPMPAPAFGTPLTPDQVLKEVTPFLNMNNPPPSGQYYTNDNPAPSLAVAMARVNSVNAQGVSYFAETGHTLSGPFMSYWNSNGGLMQFGFPISEPYKGVNRTDGKEYVQQYFQRVRMEWHPEYKGTPFEVELGLLGAEQVFKDMMGGG